MRFVFVTYSFIVIPLLLLGNTYTNDERSSGFAEDHCTSGDVRLEGGVSEYEGRVELCYSGEWYAVCDDGITDNVAEVVCSQLGLPLHDPKVVVEYGGGTVPILFEGLSCTGTEDSLLECNHNGIHGSHNCFDFEHIGVSCAPPCIEGQVRLLADRVQICQNKIWGYVCRDSDWSLENTRVVCRELGFSTQGCFKYTRSSLKPYYDQQSNFLYFLNATNCCGFEENLTDCPQSRKNSKCMPTTPAVVYCSVCIEEDVRLVGGHTPTDGRVQICVEERFVSVCDENWNNSHAAVVCRQLGYNGTSLAIRKPAGSQSVLKNDISCTGAEEKLADCIFPRDGSGSIEIIYGTCKSKNTAGVICSINTNQARTVVAIVGSLLFIGLFISIVIIIYLYLKKGKKCRSSFLQITLRSINRTSSHDANTVTVSSSGKISGEMDTVFMEACSCRS